ncbi:MAG: hypothetical protein AAF962_23385 [Actinomycetota bacterium]
MTSRPPAIPVHPTPSTRRPRRRPSLGLVAIGAIALVGVGCVPDEEVAEPESTSTGSEPGDDVTVVPGRVFVQVVAGPGGDLVLDLFAEAGGGCNVSGPYALDAETAVDAGDATVTIIGHGYQTDEGPCDELAVATNTIALPSSVADGSRIDIVLDDATNEIQIESTGDGMIARQDAPDNVELECPLADENPSVGCGVG